MFKNFYTDGGFKHHEAHFIPTNWGGFQAIPRAWWGPSSRGSFMQYQECGGGAHRGGGFASVPRVQLGCSLRRRLCISTKSAAGCSWRRGLSISSVPRVRQGAHGGGGFSISLVPRVQHGAHRVGGFPSVPRVRRGCCGLGDFNVTKQNKQTSFALKDG
jgi:hypothetical protein